MDKVYVFGAGCNSHGVVTYIGKKNIIAIIDNEPKRQTSFVLGVQVISYQDFLMGYKNERIIISTLICNDIIDQLEESGIYNYEMAPFIISGMPDSKQIEDSLDMSLDYVILGYNIVAEKFIQYCSENDRKNIKGIIPYNDYERTKININGEYEIKEDDIAGCAILDFSENNKTVFGAQYINVYENWYAYNKKDNQNLARFKNLYRGETCFLIGNGPSLSYADLETLKNNSAICFGFNLIFKIFEQTSWRPNYYVVTDYSVYKSYFEELSEIKGYKEIFIKKFYHCDEIINKANYYQGNLTRCYGNEQKFSDDISKVIYAGYTVLFDAMQIAVYMGFEKIYLLGTDFTQKGNVGEKGNHIYDDIFTEKRKIVGNSFYDIALNALEIAKEYADAHGIKIYNATRGGKLEVFERVDFDSLF